MARSPEAIAVLLCGSCLDRFSPELPRQGGDLLGVVLDGALAAMELEEDRGHHLEPEAAAAVYGLDGDLIEQPGPRHGDAATQYRRRGRGGPGWRRERAP